MKLGKEVQMLRVVVAALLEEGLSSWQRLALRKAGVSLRELTQWSTTKGPVCVLVAVHTYDNATDILGVFAAMDPTPAYDRIVSTILERAVEYPPKPRAEIRRLARSSRNNFLDMKGDHTLPLARLFARWYELTKETFEVIEVTLDE